MKMEDLDKAKKLCIDIKCLRKVVEYVRDKLPEVKSGSMAMECDNVISFEITDEIKEDWLNFQHSLLNQKLGKLKKVEDELEAI